MATLVTICGTDRSGSTMLDLILGNAQDAFSCGEVSAWYRPYRKHHFDIRCSCKQNPCPIWDRIKDAPEDQFHASLVTELGVNFIIDSSKDICWVIDLQKWAGSGNLKVQNIVIWKNPIELAYSYWKRGQTIAYWRKQFIGTYQKIIQVGIPFWAVNYDELTKDPSRKIEEICQAIGIPYFAGKERFWEKEHHFLFGSTGVRKQVDAKQSTIYQGKLYPPEFEACVDALRIQIDEDTKIQQLIERLRNADVSSGGWSNRQDMPPYRQKTFPVWYYRKKIVRRLRRYFPEKYDSPAIG